MKFKSAIARSTLYFFLILVAAARAFGQPDSLAEPVTPPLDQGSPVHCVAYSPDGNLVAAGAEDGARLWQVATGKQLGPTLRHAGHVQGIAFSPDGKLVLTGSEDKTARLWNAQTGE